MSILHLCDHRAVVYRPRSDTDATTRDEQGYVVPVYDEVTSPPGLNCRAALNWSGSQRDHGPGEQQGATRTWFLVPEFDVQERDVLAIVSGPNAPLNLRVLSVDRATAPIDVHHLEVSVEVWSGSLTEEAIGS